MQSLPRLINISKHSTNYSQKDLKDNFPSGLFLIATLHAVKELVSILKLAIINYRS